MSRLLFFPEEETDIEYSILIVDDDEMICRMLKSFLEKEGYSVITASDVSGAFMKIGEAGYNLVITDLYLEDGAGLAVLQRVKELDDTIPVIVLTGDPGQQAIIEAFRNKADDILIKPVSRDELYFRVEKALENFRLRRREKKMKDLIQSRETLFSTFMDHLPLQIFINDEQDRLLYANKKHDEFYGSRKMLLKKLEDLFPADVTEGLYQRNRLAREKGLQDYFQTMRTRDGRKRKFRTLLFPLEFGNKNLLAGIGIDMTDQILVREALKESEERLAAFIRTVPHGLLENDTEGTITLCNHGYCRLLGLEPEEVLGRNVADFQPTEDDKEKRRELIRTLNRSGEEQGSFMGKVRRSDGEIIDVQIDWNNRKDESGMVTGYVAAVTDVTRLLWAEEKIRRSEALLKSIMESPRNINIWSVDRDIRYTFFNFNHKKAMKRFWNADIEIGGRVLDYIPDADYVREAEKYYHKVLSGEHLNNLDPVTDPSGNKHVFENFSNPITDSEGSVTGATIFTMDITPRVEDEVQIKQSLREKEVLLKEIHHRVKNNLQVISSILNMQTDGIEHEDIRKALLESQNRIHSMSLVHEQLYQSENLSFIHMKTYIESLISSIIESMTSIDEGISIETSLDPVELDVDRAIPVGLILNELVSNSLKYGQVTGATGGVRVDLHQTGDVYTIIVRDYGPGIPEGRSDSGNKTSLGLQLVRALASQLDGTFSMENDSGLVCTLIFPTALRA